MAEFRVEWLTAPFVAAAKEQERVMRRAAMWGIRQTGREAIKAARATAPRRTGRLRRSIKSSRAMRGEGGTVVSITVSPRGWPARGYAPKIEARCGFMAAGRAKAETDMARIAAMAFARVLSKGGR